MDAKDVIHLGEKYIVMNVILVGIEMDTIIVLVRLNITKWIQQPVYHMKIDINVKHGMEIKDVLGANLVRIIKNIIYKFVN